MKPLYIKIINKIRKKNNILYLLIKFINLLINGSL